MRDAGRRDGEQKNSVIEMMNVRPAGVEKEVRHPARHDKDHADARDDEGQEERDERQPREMPDGPRRRIMFSGQLFFSSFQFIARLAAARCRVSHNGHGGAKEKIRRDPLGEKDFCKKSWTAFCATN